jgi:hypothetical protein
MIVAKKYEVPDDCPTGCPGNKEPFYQGNLCCSCPIFNCHKVPASPEYADKDGMLCLVEPDDFREDWAKKWETWFKGDMIEYPILMLQK